MYPTTMGTGPFKPAIVFEDALYVVEQSFNQEDEAYNRACEVFALASRAFANVLATNDYHVATTR